LTAQRRAYVRMMFGTHCMKQGFKQKSYYNKSQRDAQFPKFI